MVSHGRLGKSRTAMSRRHKDKHDLDKMARIDVVATATDQLRVARKARSADDKCAPSKDKLKLAEESSTPQWPSES